MRSAGNVSVLLSPGRCDQVTWLSHVPSSSCRRTRSSITSPPGADVSGGSDAVGGWAWPLVQGGDPAAADECDDERGEHGGQADERLLTRGSVRSRAVPVPGRPAVGRPSSTNS